MSSAMASLDPPPAQGKQQRAPVRVTKQPYQIYEPQATPTLTRAYQTDPMMTYAINKIPKASRPSALKKVMHLVLTTGLLKDATFYESSSLSPTEVENPESAEPKYQCVGIFTPPGEKAQDLSARGWWVLIKHGLLPLTRHTGVNGLLRLVEEYPSVADPAKEKVFAKGEPYYYFFLVGTDPDHRGRGLCAAIIREHQKVMQEKGTPIWLEASNRDAMVVYSKCGFERVDGEYVVGKGKCDAKGEKATGAEATGLEIFPMVWWPEGYKRRKAQE
jgi:ribosomal protein S18 acetylase RimI-like enzyme